MADDDVLDVQLDRLTVEEVEEIEEILGEPIDYAFRPDARRGRALRAIGFVLRRRTDPTFTLEQAGELVIRLVDEAPPTPTRAAGG